MRKEESEPPSIKYNRISEVMDEQGFSAMQLADKMHTYISTVSAWRANTYQPKLEKIYTIADIIQVDVRSFLMPNDKVTPFAFWRIPPLDSNKEKYTRYNRIKEVKEELGLTEKEFIIQAGVGRDSVHRWLNNKVEPHLTSLYNIADGLEIDVRALLWPNRKAREEKFWLLPPLVDNFSLRKKEG